MAFSSEHLDEIRARLRLSDIVGRRVKLVRRGREYTGLCPFHNEKTPSFTVNDQKGFYHCFGCGAHGDHFRFLSDTEGLSFPEAVERLAGEAGVELPKASPRDRQREEKRMGLRDAVELAAAFFQKQLQGSAGRGARSYLEERQVSARSIERFRLGYAPDSRSALKEFLSSRGVDEAVQIEAGLIIGGPDIDVSYDRFRNRLIFPIEDVRGRVIAFGGRALSPEARAKYLNSPETPLFHKGGLLFNQPRARKAAFEAGQIIVAEGYMDVIALDAAGFENAVAPLGTALTEDQLALLWRMVPEPVLCFDGDAAGLKAAYRAIDRALPLLKAGHSLRFALLPEGMDPDDLIRARGRAAIADVISAARPLSEMLWERETAAAVIDTPERRAGLERQLREVLGQIGDERVRSHYADYMREKLRELFGRGGGAAAEKGAAGGGFRGQPRYNQWNRGGPGMGRTGRGGWRPPALGPTAALKRSALAQGRGLSPAVIQREELLLLTVVNHPGLLEDFCESLAGLEFNDAELDSLRNEIIDIAALNASLDRGALRDHLERRGLSEIVDRLGRRGVFKAVSFAWPAASHEEAESGFLHILRLHQRALTLEAELREAERAFAETASEESFERLRELQMQARSVENDDLDLEELGRNSGRAEFG